VEKKYFGPKMSLFFTFFKKTENRPLLAHQKGHKDRVVKPKIEMLINHPIVI
jgi:hypothetical protein